MRCEGEFIERSVDKFESLYICCSILIKASIKAKSMQRNKSETGIEIEWNDL